MKYESEIRDILIENAIHLVATGGFESATTKELTHCGGGVPNVKMNEVYIYRLFGSKDDLYAAAFNRLDIELCSAFRDGAAAVRKIEGQSRERLHAFFLRAWRFILGNEARCRYYVRYYYSVYFRGDSAASHQVLFAAIVDAMAPLFKADADISAILHSVFTALLDFAVRVYNGELEDSPENAEHIFNVLYCMMMTYFE